MIFDILITLLLVAANGFFVAAEFAIVKVRASQLEVKVQEGNRFAILGKRIVQHLDGYLAATQLGVTLASLGLGWIGESVVTSILLALFHAAGLSVEPATAHAIALPSAFLTITVLHIVFGELAPKSMAIRRAEFTTLTVAYPLHVFYIVFRPLIWVLNGFANRLLRMVGIAPLHGAEMHSSDELKYLVKQGSESGAILTENYDIIKNAFDFSERTAKQVMIPRSRMVALDMAAVDRLSIEAIIEQGYSRVPCYEGMIDNMVGVVNLKDALIHLRRAEPETLRRVMRRVMIVPETKRIGQLLKDFQLQRQQLAVVVNEFGGTQGIITMEDILEELVGEIRDEYDQESESFVRIDETTMLVNASMPLGDLATLLPLELEREGEYETLAGHLLHKFGRIPAVGDTLVSDGYEFTVNSMSGNSIAFVHMRLL